MEAATNPRSGVAIEPYGFNLAGWQHIDRTPHNVRLHCTWQEHVYAVMNTYPQACQLAAYATLTPLFVAWAPCMVHGSTPLLVHCVLTQAG
jgi:hypothetical protein